MKPIIVTSLAAILVLVAPSAAEAQTRPGLNLPQREQRPTVVQAPAQPPPRVRVDSSSAALIAEARRTPRIAPLSPEVRARRARVLLGNPAATLAPTSTAFSANSAVPGMNITVENAAMVRLPEGFVHAWVTPAEIRIELPGGLAGRYVFDCSIWGINAFSWQHGAQQGQAQILDHHGLFVIDFDPNQWLSITLTPQSSLVSWTGCEITRVE